MPKDGAPQWLMPGEGRIFKLLSVKSPLFLDEYKAFTAPADPPASHAQAQVPRLTSLVDYATAMTVKSEPGTSSQSRPLKRADRATPSHTPRLAKKLCVFEEPLPTNAKEIGKGKARAEVIEISDDETEAAGPSGTKSNAPGRNAKEIGKGKARAEVIEISDDEDDAAGPSGTTCGAPSASTSEGAPVVLPAQEVIYVFDSDDEVAQ